MGTDPNPPLRLEDLISALNRYPGCIVGWHRIDGEGKCRDCGICT